MARNTLLLLVLVSALAPASLADAQSRSDRLRDLATGKAARIALLGLQPRSGAEPFIQALERGLIALGYAPGQNVVVEFHSAEGHAERVGEVGTQAARTKINMRSAATLGPAIPPALLIRADHVIR
jgi:hypothetical protein